MSEIGLCLFPSDFCSNCTSGCNPMAANQFLIDAKELTTPKKQAGVKDEKPSLTPEPVSNPKKVCTTYEKWVKKQQGDVSVLREPRL